MSVREGLLALLSEGPRNGHQLKLEFEAATGGVWALNVGQVYTTLDRLARDGLVERVRSEGNGGAASGKRYELTAAGREALAAWWELVPADDPPPRDELMLKVLFAATLGQERALAVLTEQRTALLAQLQARRREQRAAAAADNTADQTVTAMVRDALVVRAEADLRWLDLCEARLTARKGTTR
jgi:DNA-binding PadR family transcriptional regulator